MKLSRARTTATAASLLAVTGLMAGCASTPAEGGGGGGKVTLTFANADPAETWQNVIDGFEEENPNVTIKQLNIPYAQFTATMNQRLAQGSNDIDLFVVDTGVAEDFSNRGFMADLTDMQADAEAAAISADMVTQNVVDGKLVAIEPWTTSQFLYYNKDILEAAGVEPPSADPADPWTWEELTEAATTILESEAAEYPFMFNQFDTYYQLQPLPVSAGGGDGLDEDGADLTNPGWERALEWYGQIFESGIAPRGITNDKTEALFGEGKVGLYVSGPWGLNNAIDNELNFGVAPHPYFEGGDQASSTDSWSVGISAKTDQLEVAKDFLRYMTIDPEGNTKSAEVVNITPTNAEAYAEYSAAIAESTESEAAADFGVIYEYQLQNTAVHRPHVAGYSVFDPEINKMFSDIRNGADPLGRAEQAEEIINDQLERLR